jgi:hypothetical protein
MIEIAGSHDAGIDDLHAIFGMDDLQEMLIDDGIHLNNISAQLLGRHVANTIMAACKV